MDTLSHALWGSIVFGRENRKNFWVAFLFGAIPDLLSFGLLFVAMAIGIGAQLNFSAGPPDPSLIPEYVSVMYNFTHSFIIFGLLFVLVWVIFKRPIYEMLAWPLHTAMDIFTHSREFFPTPFLWPISGYDVDGIPWSHPYIFLTNVVFLLILYGYYFGIRPRLVRKYPRIQW